MAHHRHCSKSEVHLSSRCQNLTGSTSRAIGVDRTEGVEGVEASDGTRVGAESGVGTVNNNVVEAVAASKAHTGDGTGGGVEVCVA